MPNVLFVWFVWIEFIDIEKHMRWWRVCVYLIGFRNCIVIIIIIFIGFRWPLYFGVFFLFVRIVPYSTVDVHVHWCSCSLMNGTQPNNNLFCLLPLYAFCWAFTDIMKHTRSVRPFDISWDKLDGRTHEPHKHKTLVKPDAPFDCSRQLKTVWSFVRSELIKSKSALDDIVSYDE